MSEKQSICIAFTFYRTQEIMYILQSKSNYCNLDYSTWLSVLLAMNYYIYFLLPKQKVDRSPFC